MNRVVAYSSLLFIAACAEPAPTGNLTGAGGSSGALTCQSAQQSCYCSDGLQSGIQVCSPTSGLSQCSCYTPGASVTPLAGTPAPKLAATPVTSVCSALQGKTNCDARSFRSEEIPASILFVLDRSGSMSCNPPPVQSVESCNMTPLAADPSKPSRWQITVDALHGMFEKLQGTNAAAGLSFFSVDNACGVNTTPSVGIHPVTKPQLDALTSAMHGISPRGGTPIVGGVVTAYSHLHEEAMAPGKRFVVLLTDGEESCGFGSKEDDKADLAAARKHLLEVEVQKARDANIRTFVIGAPGSERARGFLSELAYAGGTARAAGCVHGSPESDRGDCHYDLTQGDDFAKVLGNALAEISGQTLSCEFPTPDGLSRMINVQYTASKDKMPVCLPLDTKACAAGANGFQFAKHSDGSDDLSKVVLCGAACEQVRSNPGSTVDVVLGCDVILQ